MNKKRFQIGDRVKVRAEMLLTQTWDYLPGTDENVSETTKKRFSSTWQRKKLPHPVIAYVSGRVTKYNSEAEARLPQDVFPPLQPVKALKFFCVRETLESREMLVADEDIKPCDEVKA